MIFEAYDVIKVPFPFTGKQASKNRPALVLSSHQFFNVPAGHSVLAMITSAANPSWPLDCPITDLQSSGLSAPSKIRAKLFTLDRQLILDRIGALSDADIHAVQQLLRQLFILD